MSDFNIDEFIGGEAPASPGTAQAPAADPNAFNIDEFVAGPSPVDPNLGEPYPIAFSGLTPETAMNKPIVDLTDRLKMSVGNIKGNIEYLKTKFQDVRPIQDAEGKDTSELAVQKDGTWYRVDAQNGEISDPWEKTKEYIADLADAAPMIGGAVVGLATGGTGALAAAATGLGTGMVRTSLGRLVGTYDATPQEQAFDIGLESLLNAAGVKIAAGVKPTASWMGNNIEKLAEAFGETKVGGAVADAASGAATSGKNLLKQIFAGMSVGIQNFDTMLENPQAVKATMKNASARAGSNIEAYHDDITMQQLNHVKDFADNARTALSKIYGQAKNKLLGRVSPDFTANFDDAIVSSYRDALSKGLGKIEFPDGKSLVGKEAVEWLNERGMKGMLEKGGEAAGKRLTPRFALLSQEEMAQAVKQGANLSDDLGYLATNKQAHDTVSQFFNQMGKFAGSAERRGVKAAEDLLNFKRVSTDLAYDLANSEHVSSMPGVKRILDQARAGVDNSVLQSMNKAGKGAGDQFVQLNKMYSELSNELVPILNTRNQYLRSGDLKVYEGLTNRFLSRPGKNVGTKYAIDATIDAAQAHGLSNLAKDLIYKKTAIQVGQAAKAFNPIQSGFSKAANAGSAGIGLYAVASANPALAAAVVGTAALKSPMTAKAAAVTTRALWKGQEMLSSMSKSKLAQFLSSPQAIQSYANATTAAPLIYDQTHKALQGQIQQTMQGQ